MGNNPAHLPPSLNNLMSPRHSIHATPSAFRKQEDVTLSIYISKRETTKTRKGWHLQPYMKITLLTRAPTFQIFIDVLDSHGYWILCVQMPQKIKT
jgi:hypothetical protein